MNACFWGGMHTVSHEISRESQAYSLNKSQSIVYSEIDSRSSLLPCSIRSTVRQHCQLLGWRVTRQAQVLSPVLSLMTWVTLKSHLTCPGLGFPSLKMSYWSRFDAVHLHKHLLCQGMVPASFWLSLLRQSGQYFVENVCEDFCHTEWLWLVCLAPDCIPCLIQSVRCGFDLSLWTAGSLWGQRRNHVCVWQSPRCRAQGAEPLVHVRFFHLEYIKEIANRSCFARIPRRRLENEALLLGSPAAHSLAQLWS